MKPAHVRSIGLSALAVLGLSVSNCLGDAEYHVTYLSSLTTAPDTHLLDINDSGTIMFVDHGSKPTNYLNTYLVSPGGSPTVIFPASEEPMDALYLNNSGQILCYQEHPSGRSNWLIRNTDGSVQDTGLQLPSGNLSYMPNYFGKNGQIYGGIWNNGFTPDLFIYTSGQGTQILNRPVPSRTGVQWNDSGDVLTLDSGHVYSASTGWQKVVNVSEMQPMKMNNKGHIIGFTPDLSQMILLANGSSNIVPGVDGTLYIQPYDINDSDEIVGMNWTNSGAFAFIYSPNKGSRIINDIVDDATIGEWNLSSISGNRYITNSGQMIGRTASGSDFILTPIGLSISSGSWDTRTDFTPAIDPQEFNNVIVQEGSTTVLKTGRNGFVTPHTVVTSSVLGPTHPDTVNNLSIGTSAGKKGKLLLDPRGPITVKSAMVVQPNGKLSSVGGGKIIASALVNHGTVSPGVSGAASTLTVEGDYVQTSTGMLQMHLAGAPGSGQNDKLEVTGGATMLGNLEIDLPTSRSFTPSNTDTFPIVTAGLTTSTFSNVKNGYVQAYYSTGESTTPDKAGLFKVNNTGNSITLSKFHQIHTLTVGIDDMGELNTPPTTAIRNDLVAKKLDSQFAALPGVVNHVCVAGKAITPETNNLQMQAAIVDFQDKKIHPGDTFIFHIGTHGGFEDNGDDGEAGIKRHIIDSNGNDVLNDHYTYTQTYLSMGFGGKINTFDFVNLFTGDEWKDVNKLFVIDSCYSGGLWAPPPGTVIKPGMHYLSQLPRCAVITGSPEDNFSYANPDGSGGYLGQALSKVLDNLPDGDINLDTIVSQVKSVDDDLIKQSGGFGLLMGVENGWGKSVPASDNIFSASTSDFELGIGGTTLVPEPGMIGYTVAICAVCLKRRRSRHN